MSDPIIIELTRPIDVVGDLRTSLTLNEPTGGMLARAGSYIRIITLENGETAVEPIPAGMLKLIAACAGIPVRSAEMLRGVDVQRAQAAVMGFLAEPEAEGTVS